MGPGQFSHWRGNQDDRTVLFHVLQRGIDLRDGVTGFGRAGERNDKKSGIKVHRLSSIGTRDTMTGLVAFFPTDPFKTDSVDDAFEYDRLWSRQSAR